MRRLVLLLVLAGVLLAPAAALAHPLGNFTINRYSRIDVSGERVYVLYVLDMAEIPTFQAGRIDGSAYARRIAARLDLRVGGRPAPLVPLRHALAHPEGAGGLRTTRLEIVFSGPRLGGPAIVSYHDNNYRNRLGWKEIVVSAGNGGRVLESDAPPQSASDELRAYPKDLLSSPLDVTATTARVEPGDGAGTPPALTGGKALQAPDRVADHGFAGLIGRGDLSFLVILGSLAVALFWGMVHALSPGHGKSIVAAYLVGQRGNARHAALLGLITTVTHTVGVFALGAVTLLLSQFIVPDDLFPWLNLASGLLVVGIGGSVLWARLRRRRRVTLPGNHHGHDDHGHDHGHGHGHGHSHVPTEPGVRGIVAVGISGGLLPCPSALVVLLAAISLHRIAFGLVLIVAFSVGLALTITAIGLVAVYAKRFFQRSSFEGRLVRLLPAASALVIVVAGLLMTARALPRIS